MKASKQKETLIENRRANDQQVVEQTNSMASDTSMRQELLKDYIMLWKENEKASEAEKFRDISAIVSAEKASKVYSSCKDIFGQIFELSWKVFRIIAMLDFHISEFGKLRFASN
jgi:hypothetical protein